MSQSSHDISTLNGLIEATFDSVNGYTEAAKSSESTRFISVFNDRAVDRQAVITSLRSEVSRLGGESEDDGTMMGGAHRMFLNLKNVVTGHDEKAIIDEVEQGEDHIKAKFVKAMGDKDLSPDVKRTIKDCYTSIKRGHDQMRDIKHSMESKGTTLG